MKTSGPVLSSFTRFLAFTVRLLLRSRYQVSVAGTEKIHHDLPLLYLPNHQALIDPFILLSQIYRFSAAVPVISEKYYDIPVAKSFFRKIGAVRVSDLEKGSRDTKVLQTITRSVYKGFRRKVNVLLYPGGQITAQGYERIINKKSAWHIVKSIPPDVQIIGVRISGLWGSMWSKAVTGKSPDFFVQLLKGFLLVMANLIFFVPKRRVSLEFEDLTERAKERASAGQKEFNVFLEEFYNLKGEEPALFLRHFFFKS